MSYFPNHQQTTIEFYKEVGASYFISASRSPTRHLAKTYGSTVLLVRSISYVTFASYAELIHFGDVA